MVERTSFYPANVSLSYYYGIGLLLLRYFDVLSLLSDDRHRPIRLLFLFAANMPDDVGLPHLAMAYKLQR